MKYFFVIAAFIFSERSFSQSGIYAISLPSLTGSTININDYTGKKILVASVSPAVLQSGYLSFLDSVQAANPTVTIIAIAALDFGGTENTSIMDGIKTDSMPHVIMVSLSHVKKESGVDQNDLMRWLTTAEENIYFNSDVVTDCQLYIINQNGALYAVLEKGVPLEVIDTLLKQ